MKACIKKIASIGAIALMVASFQNVSAVNVLRENKEANIDSLVLLAQKEFATWLKDNPYQKEKHKIDLKLLCGREFGEPSEWLSENEITTCGSGGEILVPFTPFKRMHRLYGAQPGHPMDRCHFGRYPKVDANDLTIKGDYENEARLLKGRFEQLFGIKMSPLTDGRKGFIYRDNYNRLQITIDAKSYQGTVTNIYPLVVDVWDLELDQHNRQMQSIYRRIKQEQGQEQTVPDSDNTPHSSISELGYGKLRFGDRIPADEVPYMTNDVWVSTRYEPMYGSRDIKDDHGFAIAMKRYYRDGKGLFSIDLSPGAIKKSGVPEGYDEALRKFENFKVKISRELSMPLPNTRIVVPKDKYDETIVKNKNDEKEGEAQGKHFSHEWTVFTVPSFEYKGIRISIRSTAWTDCPTTIHMHMQKMKNEKQEWPVAPKDTARRGGLLNRGISRRPVIELTEAEKKIDIDSFAGFKFGTMVSDYMVSRSHKLKTPFRAFTKVQLFRTSFEHRLSSIHLTGSVAEWDAQSLTNEVYFLRDMLSSQYDITNWETNSLHGFTHGLSAKFKNDKVSISISGNYSWLSLAVESLKVKNEDDRLRNAARKSVSYPESLNFSVLENVADGIAEVVQQEKPTITSGDRINYRMPHDLGNWESSESSCKATIYLPCRSETVGSEGSLYWRMFTIMPDGRIQSIGKEQEQPTGFWAN